MRLFEKGFLGTYWCLVPWREPCSVALNSWTIDSNAAFIRRVTFVVNKLHRIWKLQICQGCHFTKFQFVILTEQTGGSWWMQWVNNKSKKQFKQPKYTTNESEEWKRCRAFSQLYGDFTFYYMKSPVSSSFSPRWNLVSLFLLITRELLCNNSKGV